MRRAAWVLTAVTALLAGCSRPTPPGEAAGFHSIPASGWAYGDTLEFEPTPEPAAAAGTGRIAGTYGYDSARPARLRHIMRVDTLPDVEQIGLILFPDNVIPDSIQ